MTNMNEIPGETPEDSPELQALTGALARMFSEKMAVGERARLFRDLCGLLWRSRADGVDQAVRILQTLPSKIPIRDRDRLAVQFGTDTEAQAVGVIRDASRTVGAVWATTAVATVPPPVAHTAKVLLHSIVEIRLIGELYAIYDEPQARDAAWVNTVMHAWAAGEPVHYGTANLMSVQEIAGKVRSASIELVSDYSRFTRFVRGGRDGRDRITLLGSRMQRRMRFDPATWPRPDGATAAQEVLKRTVVSLVAKRLGTAGGMAVKLINASTSAGNGTTETGMERPDAYLDLAWQEHLLARQRLPMDGSRLARAVAAQENALRALSHRLSARAPVIPTQRMAPYDDDPYQHTQLTNVAIDAIETLGAQPRRLASWSVYGRNALVYATAAIIVGAPVAVLGVIAVNGLDSALGTVSVFAMPCCALPLLSFGLGFLTVGWAFRPWLGGPVPRTPLLGAVICGGMTALLSLGLMAYTLV